MTPHLNSSNLIGSTLEKLRMSSSDSNLAALSSGKSKQLILGGAENQLLKSYLASKNINTSSNSFTKNNVQKVPPPKEIQKKPSVADSKGAKSVLTSFRQPKPPAKNVNSNSLEIKPQISKQTSTLANKGASKLSPKTTNQAMSKNTLKPNNKITTTDKSMPVNTPISKASSKLHPNQIKKATPPLDPTRNEGAKSNLSKPNNRQTQTPPKPTNQLNIQDSTSKNVSQMERPGYFEINLKSMPATPNSKFMPQNPKPTSPVKTTGRKPVLSSSKQPQRKNSLSSPSLAKEISISEADIPTACFQTPKVLNAIRGDNFRPYKNPRDIYSDTMSLLNSEEW